MDYVEEAAPAGIRLQARSVAVYISIVEVVLLRYLMNNGSELAQRY